MSYAVRASGADRPAVFKLGDVWTWVCHRDHRSHEPAGCGDVFPGHAWADAWSACLGDAVRHWALYHAPDEAVATYDATLEA